MQKKYLLFDLDGTLTDSKLGITRCVQYALKSLGIDEPDLDKLECYIGPPLIDSFQRYHGLSLEQAEIGVAKYRERFRDTGIFENEVIAGIPEVLEELKKRGYVMALATSKPEEFALRITKHFNLSQYFEIEVGSGMNGELKYKEVCTLDEKPNSFRLDQSQENCFHVMEVLPYEPKGEYACIWYHAYEGVGFEVLFVGTYDKCAEYAKSSAKKVCADFKDGEYTEYYDQVVVDTGMEWQIWDIVKLPE